MFGIAQFSLSDHSILYAVTTPKINFIDCFATKDKGFKPYQYAAPISRNIVMINTEYTFPSSVVASDYQVGATGGTTPLISAALTPFKIPETTHYDCTNLIFSNNHTSNNFFGAYLVNNRFYSRPSTDSLASSTCTSASADCATCPLIETFKVAPGYSG